MAGFGKPCSKHAVVTVDVIGFSMKCCRKKALLVREVTLFIFRECSLEKAILNINARIIFTKDQV